MLPPPYRSVGFGATPACPQLPPAFSTSFFDRPVDSQNKCERYWLARAPAEACINGNSPSTPAEQAAADLAYQQSVSHCVLSERSEVATFRVTAVIAALVAAGVWLYARKA